MANLKNASIREMVIDRCLSDRTKKYSTQNIMDACNKALEEEEFGPVTSLNTIRSDMRTISKRWQAYGGNIIEEKIGRNKYYHYEDENFSIYHAGLTNDELNKLNQSLEVLERFQGLPQFEWIDELNTRIKSTFMSTPFAKSIIQFDDCEYVESKKILSTLFEAISSQTVVNIENKSIYTDAIEQFIVHPYFLKKHNNRWYLLGWDDCANKLATWSIDRMLSVKETTNTYKENHDIDFNRCFEETIGMDICPEQPAVSIRLWVSQEQYPALQANPIHHSQTVLEHCNDGNKIIHLEVKENEELIQKLLSYGEKVVVLEPESIRHMIQQHIWWSGETYAKFK